MNMRRNAVLGALITLVVSLLFAVPAQSGQGDIERTFGKSTAFRSPDWCVKRPGHPKCQPTPTATPTCCPTTSPTSSPTTTGTVSPTPTTTTSAPTTSPTCCTATPTPTTPPPTAGPLTNRPAQPAGLAYSNSGSAVQYAAPGGLVVAGRTNYAESGFRTMSSNGGHVLIYIDPVIDNNFGRYHELMLNSSACGPAVPRWPGPISANQWGYLNDFRPGSVLQSKLACVLETMVAENPHMAGWFVDDLGSRSWFPGFTWENMGSGFQQAYRDGAIGIAQTFRKVADRHGLIFMVNGTWGAGSLGSSGGGYPDMNQHGLSLADGGFVENHDGQISYFGPYSCSAQWASASPVTQGKAFNYATVRSSSGLSEYRNSNCYAYVGMQPEYGTAPTPWGAFHPTGLPSRVR